MAAKKGSHDRRQYTVTHLSLVNLFSMNIRNSILHVRSKTIRSPSREWTGVIQTSQNSNATVMIIFSNSVAQEFYSSVVLTDGHLSIKAMVPMWLFKKPTDAGYSK